MTIIFEPDVLDFCYRVVSTSELSIRCMRLVNFPPSEAPSCVPAAIEYQAVIDSAEPWVLAQAIASLMSITDGNYQISFLSGSDWHVKAIV